MSLSTEQLEDMEEKLLKAFELAAEVAADEGYSKGARMERGKETALIARSLVDVDRRISEKKPRGFQPG